MFSSTLTTWSARACLRWKVRIWVAVDTAEGAVHRTIRIERGERIAQLVFARFERPELQMVDSVSLETARGEGGFGSTGAD